MRIHRFYVAGKIPPQGAFSVIDEGLVNQLKKVLRLKIGCEITIFNGDGRDHECLISGFEKDRVVLEIKRSHASRFVPTRDVWLYAAVIKKDNFEWIVEKAAELGVSNIVPILSDRSEKKSLNMDRLSKIVIEASEQSGRGTVPAVHQIMSFGESIERLAQERAKRTWLVLAFHTEGEPFRMGDDDKSKPAALFIGPEGGWSEHEVMSFHQAGVSVQCLGKQVLRAETAAVAVLAKVMFT